MSFQTSYKALEEKINSYCNTIAGFDKFAVYLNNFIAQQLLIHIKKACGAVDDDKEKIIIMTYIIKAFIADTDKDFYLLNHSLKFCLAEFLNETHEQPTFKEYLRNSTRKMLDVFADDPSTQQKLQTARAKLPPNGNSVKLASELSEVLINRTVLAGLYAGWRLCSTDDKRPCDIYGEPLQDGWYQYVVLNNNEARFLPTAPMTEGSYFLPYKKYRAHRQLADGKNVYSAGGFKVENTKITKIDGWSGHYGTEDLKYPSYAKEVFTCIGIDMTNATVIDKINYSNDVTLKRIFEKSSAFFNSFIMSGEKAEARPELPETLTHIIPRF